VLANAAALLDADGNFLGIQGELTDTTERRRLEERLLQAQKMEAVGRLAGGIAHDFNNILTAILGYANLLAEEVSGERQAKDDVEGIRKAAARASNLTKQLLAFSRRQPISPKIIDLNALVQETERMLKRLLTEDINFSLSLSARSPTVLADAVQMEQVLINLAVNAKYAMPRGGSLFIGTRNASLDSPRTVGPDSLPPGEYLVLEVKDSGAGIAPEIRGLIFEPFFTTKPKDQGTGLGLSTVYGIARQAGGAVGCESEPGHGATFSVWLPVAASAIPQEEPVEADSISSDSPGATILFVDDDEALRNLAIRLLSRRGYRVLSAANAGEALLIAESYGRPIDLLVTDVLMPFMDGYTLAGRITTTMPDIAVLYVSGHPEQVADAGAVESFLVKPFTEEQLSRSVARMLDARRRSKKPA
jgi:two-component system cell cycle sensor histidine kinase/response regulator CckA